jgi:hypothetical protein
MALINIPISPLFLDLLKALYKIAFFDLIGEYDIWSYFKFLKFNYNNVPFISYQMQSISFNTVNAFIGTIRSGEYFTFKIIGYDFDGSSLTYEYVNLPTDLTGDTGTGWITGTPTLNSTGLSTFNFAVNVMIKKTSNIFYVVVVQTSYFKLHDKFRIIEFFIFISRSS